jgi:hypothetical protein
MTPLREPGRWRLKPDGYVTGPVTVSVYASILPSPLSLSVPATVKVGDRTLAEAHPVAESETFPFVPKPHEIERMPLAVVVVFANAFPVEVAVVVKDHEGKVLGTTEHAEPERLP